MKTLPFDQYSPEAIRGRAMRPLAPGMEFVNPMWARWLDTLKEQAGGKEINLAGPPAAEGTAFQPVPVEDPRQHPLGPHGFLGAHGGDEGDMYGIRDNQYARVSPALDALTRLGKKR
jgi:hypothetical protein